MMGAARRGDTTDAGHWATQGERMLAPVLHAAALHHRSLRDTLAWVQSAEALATPLALIEDAGATEAHGHLLGVISQESRPRDSIVATVATAIHPYSGHILDEASSATDGDWDPHTFLSGANTLFIVAPLDSGVDDPAPIVVGVLAELYGAVRRVSDMNGGRLNHPALWVLDEVANISPLPRLPSWLAESAGRGLTMILGTQDYAQLAQRWGHQEAATMWSNLTNKVVFPGVANPETLQQLEVLGGKHWMEQKSHTKSAGKGQDSSSETRGMHEVPRWPASNIYRLRRNSCLLFRPDLTEPRLAKQAR